MMLVGRIIVLLILYVGIVCHSWKYVLAVIRAFFNCTSEVVTCVLIIYMPLSDFIGPRCYYLVKFSFLFFGVSIR